MTNESRWLEFSKLAMIFHSVVWFYNITNYCYLMLSSLSILLRKIKLEKIFIVWYIYIYIKHTCYVMFNIHKVVLIHVMIIDKSINY